ncbi:unnamed protein product [Chrysodeixis includens]|uniref:Uncharacterized protein n=1 Tax=Chrysodeixis includens TaxID=689277 RepID=A0A9P0BYQ5_CHRIL|nr:unnamed protein product [Chrysodeixis includens]
MELLFIMALFTMPLLALGHFQFINEDFGDFHFTAKSGRLPPKYYPMTERDLSASEKALELMDFIQLIPKIDPFSRGILTPVGIDLPFLWLKGKVYMTNFLVAGIKNFMVRNLDLRLNNLRADLNLTLPDIYVEGDFNLQASVGFIPILLTCHLSFHIINMDISVAGGSKLIQAPSVGEALQLDSAAIQIDIENVRANLTNVSFGGSEEETGLAIAQLFATPSSDSMYDGLLKTALKRINAELIKFSSDFFKDYLLS